MPRPLRRNAATVLVLAGPLALLFIRPVSASAADVALAPAIAQIRALQARIDYVAIRTDRGPGQAVRGSLVVSGPVWALDETSGPYDLHADATAAALRGPAGTLSVDDPLDADALGNPWAVIAGRLHAEHVAPAAASPNIWMSSSGLRIYLDPAADRILGVDAESGLSFAFGDWVALDGVELPRSVVRIRAGVTDGTYRISDYRVSAVAPPNAPTLAAPANAPALSAGSRAGAALAPASEDTSAAWLRFFTACEFLLLALLIVAWLRRDAFTAGACGRLARDTRAFKDAGTSVFVSPDGILFFDGCSYRIGAEFYGRPTLVQSSALFLRVSAKDSAAPVVVPRKFRPVQLPAGRGRVRGFSLVEVLAAMALFSLVIVGGVYPTLLSINRAHAFAEERSRAIRVAANALTDQEDALAYGTTVVDGVATSTLDGMQVEVSVVPAGVPGASQVTVAVSSADGELARVSTTVGPPVPAPQSPASRRDGP